MFNKVYIEISNYCNLNCSFCSDASKNTRILNEEQFKHILNEIKPYTSEITLHILGEPLVHPNIVNFLNIVNSYNFDINLTTNGVLLKKKKELLNIKLKKLNISLNSALTFSEDKLKEYMDNVLEFVKRKKEIDDDVVINLRLWAYDKYDLSKIVHIISLYYNIQITSYQKIRLTKKVILNFDKYFKWPDINDDITLDNKSCLGGKSHIGILSNGKVVICCLDSSGHSNLGNIFDDSLKDILSTCKYTSTIKYFNENKAYLDICKKCSFDYKRK